MKKNWINVVEVPTSKDTSLKVYYVDISRFLLSVFESANA